MEINNRGAKFNYFIEDTVECGIVLRGTEIKSIRQGNCNLKDSYARIKNNEVYLVNLFISKYDEGNSFNHEETRERKLLLHDSEIRKLAVSINQEGYSLVPLKLYIKNGLAKILLGVGKGKKLYDKRETIKKRDLARMQRNEN